MKSQATSVNEYLAELPSQQRQTLEAVRKTILDSLDTAYQECIQYGMIGYVVPHSVYPPGYHVDPKQPLPFVALAAQKNHFSIYFMALYQDPELLKWFQQAWASKGKKLDMGKSCIRFKKLDDLALDILSEAIRRVPTQSYIRGHESTLASMCRERTVMSLQAKTPQKTKPSRKKSKVQKNPSAKAKTSKAKKK